MKRVEKFAQSQVEFARKCREVCAKMPGGLRENSRKGTERIGEENGRGEKVPRIGRFGAIDSL